MSDNKKCSEIVISDVFEGDSFQCMNDRGHGPNGEFCLDHVPHSYIIQMEDTIEQQEKRIEELESFLEEMGKCFYKDMSVRGKAKLATLLAQPPESKDDE